MERSDRCGSRCRRRPVVRDVHPGRRRVQRDLGRPRVPAAPVPERGPPHRHRLHDRGLAVVVERPKGDARRADHPSALPAGRSCGDDRRPRDVADPQRRCRLARGRRSAVARAPPGPGLARRPGRRAPLLAAVVRVARRRASGRAHGAVHLGPGGRIPSWWAPRTSSRASPGETLSPERVRGSLSSWTGIRPARSCCDVDGVHTVLVGVEDLAGFDWLVLVTDGGVLTDLPVVPLQQLRKPLNGRWVLVAGWSSDPGDRGGHRTRMARRSLTAAIIASTPAIGVLGTTPCPRLNTCPRGPASSQIW